LPKQLLYHKNIEVSRGNREKPAGSVRHPHNQRHGQTRLPPDLISFNGEGSGKLLVGKKGDFPGVLSQVGDCQKTIKENQSQGLAYQNRVCDGVTRFVARDPDKDEKRAESPEKISYVQSLAKGYNGSGNTDQDNHCGNRLFLGECDNGHQFLRACYCGKEWCNNPNCVEATWKRRIARALPKVAVMEKAGYFVLTIPEEMREAFRSLEIVGYTLKGEKYLGQKNLNELRTGIKRKLKRTYPELRAIIRYHWFGDKKLGKYHPHLNILVDDLQALSKSDLTELKRFYKDLLERVSGIRIGDKKIDLYYQYLQEKGQIIHAVKYIMRPTFLLYDKTLSKALKGFRNNVYWGKWRDQTTEEIEKEAIQREATTRTKPEVVLLSNNICPICGKPIVWYKKMYSFAYTVIAKEIGQGYYRVTGDNMSDWFRDWEL